MGTLRGHRGDGEGTLRGHHGDTMGMWGHQDAAGTLGGHHGDAVGTSWGRCGDIMGTMGTKGTTGPPLPPAGQLLQLREELMDRLLLKLMQPLVLCGDIRDVGTPGTAGQRVCPSVHPSVCLSVRPPAPVSPPPLSPLTSRYRWIPGSVPLSRNTVSHLSPMRTLGWGTAVMGGGDTALGTPQDGRGTQWGHGSAQRDRGGNGDMGATWGATRGVTHRGHGG